MIALPQLSTGDMLPLAVASTSLPSFSTPGFKQAKPLPIQTSDPIIISDDSNHGTQNVLKRTSSDSDVSPDPPPQAFKRSKKVLTTSDKENLPPKASRSSLSPSSKTGDDLKSSSQLTSEITFLADPGHLARQNPPWMDAHLDLMEVCSIITIEQIFNSLM